MPNTIRTALLTLTLGTLVVGGFAGCASPSSDVAASDTPPAEASDGRLVVVEDGLGAELGEQLADAATEAFAGISAPGAVIGVRT
ncbi:MAG TPA: hypothetical protein VI121_10750, partial [Agromyces sp.]